MKRKAIEDLIKWKELNNRTPILITGAKGVGKTYLAYDFAKAFFEYIYYINFEREPLLRRLFKSSDKIKTNDMLSEHFHLNSENIKESRILILDEINCCIEAMEIMNAKYLSENFDYIIIISSYPVSNEYSNNILKLPIYPFEFDEFLRATSNEWYIELISTHFKTNKKIPDIVHKELLELHQLYLRIGGMPGIINEYLNLSSTVNISEQHSFLIGSYHDYILRDNSDSDAFKMNQVFDSLILQLMKDNKKFQYKLIRKGTTHSMYKEAIRKLSDLNYIIKCNRISSDHLIEPLKTFENAAWFDEETDTNFKLYLPDSGLLYSKIVEEYGSSWDLSQNKALLENYVAQSLQAKHYPFAFWESDSMAKIDFIIYKNKELIPIEIHENSNTRSKSISVLKQKCDFPYAVKISSKNFELSNQIKYVPYYAIFCI
ncbi:MAG: AAA family ATPase [Herbinix sp.]|nr:AAA family ATPase [Herbinix sp.]